TLGSSDVQGDYSGRPDDRWIFTTTNASLQWNAIAALAAASDTLKGWDDELAKDCLDPAIKAWNGEREHPTPQPSGPGWDQGAPEDGSGTGVLAASQGVVTGTPNGGNSRSGASTVSAPGLSRTDLRIGQDWAASLELTIATDGADPYKTRLKQLFPQMISPEQMGAHGWMAVRVLRYLDASAKDEMREAVKASLVGLDKQLDSTPFGVPPSLGTWGGSAAVVDMAIRMYFLHKAFPDLVSAEYTLRAVNYILGTHPVSSTSYVAGVGTVSKTKTYSNNRADNAYIPGAVIPGYVIINPDFPECIDDFGFLWFEDEAVVAGSASWVVAGNAAVAITQEAQQAQH